MTDMKDCGCGKGDECQADDVPRTLPSDAVCAWCLRRVTRGRHDFESCRGSFLRGGRAW